MIFESFNTVNDKHPKFRNENLISGGEISDMTKSIAVTVVLFTGCIAGGIMAFTKKQL